MKRVISIALIMAFAVLMLSGCKPFGEQGSNPYEYREDASPEPVTNEPTAEPIPYNRKEYDALLAFFELADENGVKNGEKCFIGYDPQKADFWGASKSGDNEPWIYWNDDGDLTEIVLSGSEDNVQLLKGELKLDGFSKLEGVFSYGYIFEAVRVENCLKLNNASFNCTGEAYIAGDSIWTGFSLFSNVHCHYESTGEGSGYPEHHRFTADLTVEGSGEVGIYGYSDEHYYVVKIHAGAAEGHKFIGWYDADGNLFSTENTVELSSEDIAGCVGDFIYTAKFE